MSEECRWCNQKEDGGVPLHGKSIPLGDLGEINVDTSIWNYDQRVAPCISTAVWFDPKEEDGHGGHTMFEEEFTINYCPACGKKLRYFI